jgi:drug/metabolite transporter (DMT)-like permease
MATDEARARRRATLAGLAAVPLWASLALLTTLTAGLPPFQVLTCAFAVAGLGGVAWAVLRPGGGLHALRMPAAAAALTISALFGNYALYLVALKTAPVVEANLINYLWPLMIVLLAAASAHTRVRPLQWLGTALGLAAAVLLVTHGEALQLEARYAWGYAAAFGAAFLWALYSVLNRRYAHVPATAIFGACVAVAVLAAITHATFETWVAPTPLQWATLVAIGAGPTGLSFGLWDRASKHGDLAVLGTVTYATPVLSTGVLLLAGRAEPHWTQAVGVGLLLAGAWLSVRGEAKPG